MTTVTENRQPTLAGLLEPDRTDASREAQAESDPSGALVQSRCERRAGTECVESSLSECADVQFLGSAVSGTPQLMQYGTGTAFYDEDFVDEDGEAPLVLAPEELRWPLDGTYASWALKVTRACRTPGVPEIFCHLAAVYGHIDGKRSPFRVLHRDGRITSPAPHLIRKMAATITRCIDRGDEKILIPRKPGTGRPRGGATLEAPKKGRRGGKAAPLHALPPARRGWTPEHHYAVKWNARPVPTEPGPRPAVAAPQWAVRNWLESTAEAVGADEEGRAAFNDPAFALVKGSFAGSRAAYADSVTRARVYKGTHKTPAPGSPPFLLHQVVVCGDLVTNEEELNKHAECFKRDRPFFNFMRDHLRGLVSEDRWCDLTRDARRHAFDRPYGYNGVVRCVAREDVPFVPGALRVPATRSRPAYDILPGDKRYPLGRLRYQGNLLSSMSGLDWACGCEGHCDDGEDEPLPSLPPPLVRSDAGFQYQGSISSVPVGSSGAAVTIAHTFPQVDAILAVMAESGAGATTARKLTQVAALLVGLATSQSGANALAVLTAFVAADDWLYGHTARFVSAVSSRAFSYQGKDDEEDDGWGGWSLSGLAKAFWATAVMAALRELGTNMSDTIVLGISEFSKQIKVAASKDAARCVLDAVVGYLKEFWGRLNSAWEQKSWAPLFGVSRDPKRWAKWSEGVLVHHQLLVTPGPRPGEKHSEIAELAGAGAIPEWIVSPLTNSQYLALVEYLHEQGNGFLAGVASGTLAASIRTIVSRLSAKIGLVTASIRGQRTRAMPFFVYMYGPAGTGKSNLAKHIFQSVGHKKGLPTDDQARWLWQNGVNFQDGLDISKWCIAMDDVDHVKGTMSVRDELFPQVITRMVNNEPFPVEAAGVEEKGKNFAAPLLVTQASNFDTAKVVDYSAYPTAFWRRVKMFANVRIKPEFRRRDLKGNLLEEVDPGLAHGKIDIYDIYVGEYRGPQDDATASYFKLAAEPIGIADFMVLIHERMAVHEAYQDELLRASDAGERCARCFLAKGLCGCPKLVPQMMRRDTYAVLEREATSDDEGESLSDDGEPVPGGAWFQRVYDAYFNGCLRCDDFARSAAGCCAETAIGAGAFCAVAALKGFARLPQPIVDGVAKCCGPTCTRGAWALSLAVQMVEDAVTTFPFATAATILVFAGGIYALYAGGTWLLQGRGAGVDTSSWVPVPPIFGPQAPSVPPKATWTLEQLEAAVSKSLFRFRTKKTEAFALAVTPNVLAVPTHLVDVGGEFELELSPGRWQTFVAHPSWVEKSVSNGELSYLAVRTVSTAGVMAYMPPVHNLAVLQFDEGKLLGPGDRGPGAKYKMARGLAGEITLQAELPTQAGDCGRPYAVRSGSSWWLAGVHYGLLEYRLAPSVAVAAPLTQRDVRSAAVALDGAAVTPGAPAVVPQGLSVTSAGDPWVLDPAPRAWSEVLTAIETGRGRNAVYLGTLRNGPPGASPRTRLRDTLFADLFRDLELKYCGVTPYWGPPIMRGRMEAPPGGGPERWCSPLQSAFEASKSARPDRATFVVALMDYLAEAETLYWEGLHTLSAAEALCGVPEFWHNPVNPSTSSGLPKNQPKWMQIQRAFKDVKVEPGLFDLLEDQWRHFEAGTPLSVPGAWTLKDEPVKPGKEARVFTVLPASFNITLSRVLAPVSAAMRAHPEFFECWVGVDMTSSDVERLVRFLRHVCPDLSRVGDIDVKKQDKSFGTFSWLAVRLVYSAIGYHAGLDRVLIETAIRSEEAVRYLYKGDLFEHPQDPSGVKLVIENNSIDGSVKARYAYYLQRPEFVASVDWRGWLARFAVDPTVPEPSRFTFRRDCANAQFGDDNVHALRPGVAPFIDAGVMLSHCGVEVTSGDKTGSVTLGPLSSVSFLKRALVYDAELGYHLAPLALKSIIKSCVVRMPTTLSDSDHAALVLTHVVREAVLHGPVVFEEFSQRARKAAARLNIEQHKLLRIHTYDNYRERLRKQIFSVYRDLAEVGSNDYLAAESAGLIGAQLHSP